MIDLDLTSIVRRALAMSEEGRPEDADALFAEYSEWLCDQDEPVLLCPSF